MKPHQTTKPKKELTARRMLWRNYRAIESAKGLRYTKQQYSNAISVGKVWIKWGIVGFPPPMLNK